jgi:hypothetical protein
MTSFTLSPIDPRCTGMCGALTTRSPSRSKIAQEKSRRSLTLTECAVLVQRDQHLTRGRHPLSGLDNPGVQQLGQHDLAVEQAWPVLVRDAQRVAEAAGDDQDGRLALALEQGVGGGRGAQPDGLDLAAGDRLGGRHAEQVPDRGDGRVGVPPTPHPPPRPSPIRPHWLRQQLVRDQRAIRAPGHHVGERAAPVDPELPATAHGLALDRLDDEALGIVEIGGELSLRVIRALRWMPTITSWNLRFLVPTSSVSRSQERIQRTVRCWQAETARAQAEAGRLAGAPARRRSMRRAGRRAVGVVSPSRPRRPAAAPTGRAPRSA